MHTTQTPLDPYRHEEALKTVGVRLPLELRRKLAKEARHVGTTVAGMVRAIVAEYYRQNSGPR